jgi:uncharacterized membrane protein
MTDMDKQMPAPPPSPPGRGIRIALAVSVALNLGVLGVIGGAMLKGGPDHHGPMVRDVGFGFFSEALTPEQREDLRQRFIAGNPRVLSEWSAMRNDAFAVLTALRNEPFDPEALKRALDAQGQRMSDRLATGQMLIEEFLLSLPDDQRAAFADRLEDRMRHIGRPGKGGDGDGDGD